MSDDKMSDEKCLRLVMLENSLGPEMGKHGEALLRRTGRKASIEEKKE